MKIIIDAQYEGLTIKKLLFDRLLFSRSAVTALKKRPDGILVNGEHKTVRYILQNGDILNLETKDAKASPRINESEGEIDIIYEDEYIVAVNKPVNLAVHPSKKIQDDTLAGRMLHHFSPMVFRAMGRLDKDTSGVVVCSKDKVTSAKLFKQISERQVQKEYILIAKGKDIPSEGIIKTGIIRDEKSYITRRCIPYDEAKDPEKAITKYRIIYQKGDYRLISASPITGRTHQLRAHFSYLGNPIIGDTLYGESSEFIGRQALHAYKLSFKHPESGEDFSVIAPILPDMENAVLEIFGLDFEKIQKNSRL